MAIKKEEITYNNMEEKLYIDPTKIGTYKKIIIRDYNNIISDINNIKLAYSKLYNDKTTSGEYKTVLKNCVAAAKKKTANDGMCRDNLINALDEDIQEYILSLVAKVESLNQRVSKLEQQTSGGIIE